MNDIFIHFTSFIDLPASGNLFYFYIMKCTEKIQYKGNEMYKSSFGGKFCCSSVPTVFHVQSLLPVKVSPFAILEWKTLFFFFFFKKHLLVSAMNIIVPTLKKKSPTCFFFFFLEISSLVSSNRNSGFSKHNFHFKRIAY